MLRAAAEQFGDKTVDEVMFSKFTIFHFIGIKNMKKSSNFAIDHIS